MGQAQKDRQDQIDRLHKAAEDAIGSASDNVKRGTTKMASSWLEVANSYTHLANECRQATNY